MDIKTTEKQIYMGKEVKKRNRSVAGIALILTVGGIFTALGIAMAAITVSGLLKYGIKEIGAGIIMPLIFITALSGLGGTALFIGGKQIYLWIKEHKTDKHGRSSTARIIDHKSAHFSENVNTNIRYALTLMYNDCGKDKTFTTDYIFDINEFRYLKTLDCVKIKTDGNFVTVCEPFTEDIYKLDSKYGIERMFFRQKPVAILLKLWMAFFILALVFLVVSLIIGNNICLKVAVPLIFAVHFPFATALAVYLIKWLNRKK